MGGYGVYVGTDGKLYGGSYDTSTYTIDQVVSNTVVNDGQWHNVALVIDGSAQTMTVYLDGQLIGSVSGSPQYIADSFNQVGTGYTDRLAGRRPADTMASRVKSPTSASGARLDQPPIAQDMSALLERHGAGPGC